MDRERSPVFGAKNLPSLVSLQSAAPLTFAGGLGKMPQDARLRLNRGGRPGLGWQAH